MVSSIVLLGSTGSIGGQTLDVARLHNIKVRALSCGTNTELLERQAREFKPEYVSVGENSYNDIKTRLADTDIKIVSGTDGLCLLASLPCERTVNAVVGMVGLRPTLAAIEAGNSVALANKETLVTGGALVVEAAKKHNTEIIPIDSEHSAIFQCLSGNNRKALKKILLTASGGPFWGYTKEMLRTVTMHQALAHPNWVMGRKITIDSATMMNKGLEFLEAMWLFDVTPEQIEIVVHRQSVIHSAVEFVDGAIIAQMGVPDMRVPIQYALSCPDRFPSPAKSLSLFDMGNLTFERPNEEVFICTRLAKEAAKRGGNAATIINAANEAAVGEFLAGRIKFSQIPELIALAAEKVGYKDTLSLNTILATEAEAREFVLSHSR